MKTGPKCKKCNNSSVEANAGIFSDIPYWYCRTCKVEVNNFGWAVTSKRDLSELEDELKEQMDRMDEESGGGYCWGSLDNEFYTGDEGDLDDSFMDRVVEHSRKWEPKERSDIITM